MPASDDLAIMNDFEVTAAGMLIPGIMTTNRST